MEDKFLLVIVDHDKKMFHVEDLAGDDEDPLKRKVDEAQRDGRDVQSFWSRMDTVNKTIDAAQHEYKGYAHTEDMLV
ncbi:hypothetical protein [Pseudalkalibacillus caeni]|uniref:Uncharacterized protein n=1 Tax=Exobacillus caeni TaxID=2574798 RepID=A0A5R9FEL6_9BACL|nr:hypothetical protein [Pseudalkalibacillus caeni]TLS39014.1 hypothetical protein FCL54_01515 [Pseudalkalibacillus caeni]